MSILTDQLKFSQFGETGWGGGGTPEVLTRMTAVEIQKANRS